MLDSGEFCMLLSKGSVIFLFVINSQQNAAKYKRGSYAEIARSYADFFI
jgi:hypothetical protein